MNKASKYYKKALLKYHKGYIDEAIYYCGQSIDENNKFKAATSLKGVLFYFKGDLENARDLWDFNVRINKDVVSKKYIENTRFDDEFLNIFAKAIKLINEVRINEALELLKECEVSDFNVINVSNYSAICLIKQGNFEEAKIYLDKVLNIDKTNAMALNNIKMMKNYGIIESDLSFKILAVILVIVLVVGSTLSISYIHNKTKNTGKAITKVESKGNTKGDTTKTTVPAKTTPATTPPTKTSPDKETQEEVFPTELVKKHMSDMDFDSIYADISKWKDKNVSVENKTIIAQSEELLKNNAISYFYNKGNELSVEGNPKAAADYYYRVYTYGKNNSLYEDGLFFLGRSQEKSGNNSEALKYYEEYNNEYPKGSYEDTALYELSMMYKSTDLNKSKKFAEILSERFYDSIYNNSNIKEILSK